METINNTMGRRVMFTPAHLTRTDLQHKLGIGLSEEAIKKVQIFLHRIIIKNTYLNSKDNEGNEGFVQISKTERRTIFGKEYIALTDLLQSKNIVEVAKIDWVNKTTGEIHEVEAYGKGHSTKKYRIVGYTSFRRTDVTEDTYIVSKLNKLRSKGTEAHAIYSVLQSNTDLLQLKDSQELRESLTIYYRTRDIMLTGEEYVAFFNSVETPITVDTFGNRFHAKHTTLKRVFRQYLEFQGFEGKPLVNIDIVNSQPLLLSLITPELVQTLAEECAEAIPILEKYCGMKDFNKFRNLCLKGKIYEYIMKGFKQLYDIEINRDEAKDVFYLACYSSYPKAPENIGSKVMALITRSKDTYHVGRFTDKQMKPLALYFIRSCFPSLFNLNLEIKKLNWKNLANHNKKQYKMHANSPMLAQRIESSLLLKLCAANINQAGILFTTIHDSFLVMEKDALVVRRVIQATFEQLHLPKPRVKTETVHQVPSTMTVAA
ncbi:hypothetical protein [Pontibacter vulgaris]|uniref:hypothetical protein n=1 Tax=Pontibacter vulgaris TaxID=2905679 RepID=UPI001FA772DA|nr:hypothetical protein [Pontibacter vulgaris]